MAGERHAMCELAFMAVAAKITVFWDVTLYVRVCRPVEIFRRFGGAYCLHLLPRKRSSLAEVVSPVTKTRRLHYSYVSCNITVFSTTKFAY